jgi:hypothetical protein
MRLKRLSIPFVPAETGIQALAEFSAPGFPAFAGMNGDWFDRGVNLNSSHSSAIATAIR